MADGLIGTEGWMEKKGEQWGSAWKNRYFRLEGDKLRYYAAKEDDAPKGEIDLSTGPTVRFADDKNKEAVGPCEIQIVTQARVYRLRCQSTDKGQKWIRGLRQAITALADPSSDQRLQQREQSFRRLEREGSFQELSPAVAYRCKWSAAEPNGAQVWHSAVRDEVGDGGFVRPGEVIDATGLSDDTEIGACLKFELGYVQLTCMEPIEEMNLADYMDRLGRSSGGTAGTRSPSVKMQGRLVLRNRVGSGNRYPSTFVDENAMSYRLRGCRLEELTRKQVGGYSIEKPIMEGLVCQVQPCSGLEVDVELQRITGERNWVTLTAPDASAATEWTLALTAGRSPHEDSLPDGTRWLRDTKGFQRVPAANPLDVLSDPKTSSTGTRMDALYNQPHMRSVSLAIEFCDITERGRLSGENGKPVSARLQAEKAPFPAAQDLREKYAKLFHTEQAIVRASETPSGQRARVAFSAMPAVNTRWDHLALQLVAADEQHVGHVHFRVSELAAATGNELVRVVHVIDPETEHFRWKTVDECDTKLAEIESRLRIIDDKLERLQQPVVAEEETGATRPQDLEPDAVVPQQERQSRDLQQQRAQLQQEKVSLEHCREIRLEQAALQIECRITAFFHPEPATTYLERRTSLLSLCQCNAI